MKRFVMVLAALMVLGSSFAYAKDDVKVEAGIKMWNNEWESKDPIDGTMKFDAALLIGPAVVVTLPSNVFFEASYLMSVTDYEKKGACKEFCVNDLSVKVQASCLQIRS